MAIQDRSRQAVLPPRGTAPPIVLLPLAAPGADDRSFNSWIDFLYLLPLEADGSEPDGAALAG